MGGAPLRSDVVFMTCFGAGRRKRQRRLPKTTLFHCRIKFSRPEKRIHESS